MQLQFLPQYQISIWKRYEDLVVRVKDQSREFFGGYWYDNSVWSVIFYLAVDMKKWNVDELTDNKSENLFFKSAISHLDFSKLEKVSAGLKLLSGKLPNVNASIVAEDVNQYKEEWETIAEALDLTKDGSANLWNRVSILPPAEIEGMLDSVRQLVADYNDFRVNFLFVSSILLYYIPPSPIGDLDSLKYFLSLMEEEGGQFDPEKMCSLLSFIGWSFYRHDVSASQLFSNLLFASPIDAKIFNSRPDTLFLTSMMHLVFDGARELTADGVSGLVGKLGWRAISFGVPLADSIEDRFRLKSVPSASVLADTLAVSKEIIYFEKDRMSVTVGDFLKGFTDYNIKNQGDSVQLLLHYVGDAMRKNAWSDGLRGYLFDLLHCYTNFRNR